MKLIRTLIILVAIGALAVYGYNFFQKQNNKTVITNFEQCAAAGYPIQESYPERCVTPDGQAFTRQL